jgi:hypothetical protein
MLNYDNNNMEDDQRPRVGVGVMVLKDGKALCIEGKKR